MIAPPELLEPGVYQIDEDDWRCVPETLGPTWSKDLDWDGPRDPEGYILPRLTLGWQAIKWAEDNLLADETDDAGLPLPFRFTNEQLRFILWFYAIDNTGHFVYREIVLQRLKGWGKDPVAAVIAAIEFVGPCRFAGWATRDMPDLDLQAGDPVAKSHPRAWVQIAAVSREQTKNTMTLFAGLFSPECIREHSIDIGKEVIYAYKGARRIESVTSSPRALEGNRPTLVIKNETHHWLSNNEGHAMADAIERNATKAKGGAARTLAITNAYEPSENSVAQQEREAYELSKAGLAMTTDTLYDSLEAPEEARLRPVMDKDLPPEKQESLTRRYLTRVLEAVRGDAWWLNIPDLVSSITNPRNRPSRSRRFWYNQIVASEESWANPAAITAAVDPDVAAFRREAESSPQAMLEVGWMKVGQTEPIVMFGDMSKSDDDTALVGCRLSDGYIFTIGVWSKPPGDRGKDWRVPRDSVDMRVRVAKQRFNVVAFWVDPSHTKDDSGDGSRYWDALIDQWMRDFKDDLDPKHWPVKSGHNMHAIMFDMTSRERHGMFVAAAEEFIEALETVNDIEEFAPKFRIDGHPALVQQMKNARRFPTEHGISLMKDGRESKKKIDLAVCAVGSRMLRRIVLNRGVEEDEEPAEVWGRW